MIEIMFHGSIIKGYFIKRIGEDRFMFYTPKKNRTLDTIDPFMNLHKRHFWGWFPLKDHPQSDATIAI